MSEEKIIDDELLNAFVNEVNACTALMSSERIKVLEITKKHLGIWKSIIQPELEAKIKIYEEIIKKSTFAPLLNKEELYTKDYVEKYKQECDGYKYRNDKIIKILQENRLHFRGTLAENGVYKEIMALLTSCDSNE